MDDILPRLREILTASPIRWLSLTATLSGELLARPPAPGEWSALECLQHLVDTEDRAFQVRLRALLKGDPIASFDPDAAGMRPEPVGDPVVLAAQFHQLRIHSLAALATITVDDLTRTSHHEEFGVVTLGELLHEWAGHDLMHTVQAERALMQPFILGSGPWHAIFADHFARTET